MHVLYIISLIRPRLQRLTQNYRLTNREIYVAFSQFFVMKANTKFLGQFTLVKRNWLLLDRLFSLLFLTFLIRSFIVLCVSWFWQCYIFICVLYTHNAIHLTSMCEHFMHLTSMCKHIMLVCLRTLDNKQRWIHNLVKHLR